MKNEPSHDELAEDQLAAQQQTADQRAEEIDQALDAHEPDSGSAATPATDDQRVLEAEREVLRLRAELENFRKRMQRDADQQLKYANLPLIRDLLDVVDNLNRAREAAQDDQASNQALLDGVNMVSQQLASVLDKFGCQPVEAVGVEFDPNYHEAIAQMPSDEYAAGIVSQEVAVGYVLHDRVVRPSSVVVSSGPAGE